MKEAETLRVTLVISSLRGGGAERVLSWLAGTLAERGHQVAVITEASSVDDHYRLPAGVAREELHSEWKTSGFLEKISANLARLVRLRNALLRLRPDCVIAFGETTNLRTLLAAGILRLPIIVSERVDPRYYEIPKFWQGLRKLLYPTARALVVQTEDVRAWAERITKPARVHVIPNPVRPTDVYSRPAGMPPGKTVISVGRLAPQKNFELLLSAFASSALWEEGWKLVILGEGTLRAPLLARAKQLRIDEAVLLPGAVENVDAWLQHASLFVLASRFEGFPNSLLEAMAAGLPCISTDCPSGPRTIIDNRRTGILVPVEDEFILASTLRALADDERLRSRLGAAAKADVAQRFDGSKISETWAHLIAHVARNGRVA